MSAPTNDAEHRAFHVSATELAEQAWDAVRGTDPAFKSCLSDFRSKLVFVTQAIIKTGRSGAVGLEAFEAEVKRLLSETGGPEPDDPAAKVEEVSASDPTDVSDDAATSAAGGRPSRRRK